MKEKEADLLGKTILIVEDEQNIVDILSFNLSREGYNTLDAYDGLTGLQLALEQNPDLILLDLMLPGMNGFDVCREVRRSGSSTPILMLTAREEEADKVLGLELGADDYITKPFSMRELLARVKANIRRTSMSAPPPSAPKAETEAIRLGRVAIDREKAVVTKDGQPLELTQREYDLLCFLAAQPGKVYSREALMEHVWNYEGYVGDVRAVDVAVRRLREKIEDDPASPTFIMTKRGMGYLFGG
jgi:two-component system response regulator VicR